MSNYVSNATLPIRMVSDNLAGQTTPIQEQVPNCKVRFIESGSLIDAEKETNKFMDGKYVLSVDIIPAGLNYITKILYF